MPRRANNRVGVEVVGSHSQKADDEPHADNVAESIDEGSAARCTKVSVSNPTMEAAKAQRQKELLRKKKAERRAHAKQRTAEKLKRHEEKKQKRELHLMLEQDVPVVEPKRQITQDDTSTSTLLRKKKAERHSRYTGDTEMLQEVRVLEARSSSRSLDDSLQHLSEEPISQWNTYSSTLEIVPKNPKPNYHHHNSANAAALTIQKALKKKFRECKTMFRQPPRIFAEEVVCPPAEIAASIPTCSENSSTPEVPSTVVDRLVAAIDPSSSTEGTATAPPSPERSTAIEPICIPPLKLPRAKSSTPPPRSPSSASSSSRSCSSCTCSDSGSYSYSCSCSSSCSSSSSSETTKSSRRCRSHTARSSQRRQDKSSRHTTRSTRGNTDRSSGPSLSLLPVSSQEAKNYDEMHHLMATRIQSTIRGYRGRERARQRQLELDQEIREEALYELQKEAVVKIQTRARGVLVRKKMPISDTERRRRRRKRREFTMSPPGSPQDHWEIEQGIYEDPGEIGEWPLEVDLELQDDWHDLNQLTTQGDSVTQTQFLSRGRLRVFCGTWNMHAKKPVDDLRLWIRLNKYHIVAIGSEECVNSIAKSVLFTSKKSWEDQLKSTVGEDYILVASHALTAIHNVVFVHSSVLPLLGNIQSDAVATGLGNQLGNKGGVGIAFSVGTTSFAFVNCHFEAHQRNVSRRNGNFHRINHELKLSPTVAGAQSPMNPVAVAPTPGSPMNDLHGLGRTSANRFSMGGASSSKRTVSELFDRVFWYGDLNYRINGTRRMVDTLLLRNQYDVLLANDQLQREMKAGNVFTHFKEGQLNFRPTYKFDKRSDVYDSSAKQRIPSWTDRVLYLSNNKAYDIELLSYRSQMSFRTSDHRPVCATFQVNFRATGRDESLQSPRQNSSDDKERANNVTSQACTIQ
ncbi:Inositol polyphosphate 5-phosphatase [Phytophthora megakarya]|uniref:Inositol polyphosphate 5-phosphatase n=1 Tax=Phytophthora megakarya TaxID=4795 RepID=A0A225WX34_9STRA|nr:Inositol polyphosphate 5-phosphatase [Phytophthora megakarya]